MLSTLQVIIVQTSREHTIEIAPRILECLFSDISDNDRRYVRVKVKAILERLLRKCDYEYLQKVYKKIT